jgi:hypothetical protein
MNSYKKTRRVRRKKGKRRLYFNSDTHDAIVRYQDSDDDSTRHEIYIKDILPAFDKLCENLIFIHGFAKNHDSYESLKNDCVAFLYETLDKFDHTRGTKAFSYFNVVAKNWLIIQSKKKIKSNSRLVSMDDSTRLSSNDLERIENHSISPPQDFFLIKKECMDDLFSLMEVIRTRLKSENELACMNAIITLFKSIDEIDLLNKRAVFVYMRSLSNLNPKQLSVAMSTIRKHYRDLIKEGEFDIFLRS